MKNIYELSPEDKSKYLKEFNKLEYTKNINLVRGPALIITFIGVIALGILEAESLDSQAAYDIIASFTALAFILFTYETFVFEKSFVRWLKIKHKIEN